MKVSIVFIHLYTTENNKYAYCQAMRTFIQVALNTEPKQLSKGRFKR